MDNTVRREKHVEKTIEAGDAGTTGPRLDWESREFFDNLIPIGELLAMLKYQYRKRTVYGWVRSGMPHKRIRGKLWFPRVEVVSWLERSS